MTFDQLVAFSSQIHGRGAARLPECMPLYSQEELGVLARAALTIPQGGKALEVGVYVGRSASILLQLEKEKDLRITFIDNWGWNAPIAFECFKELLADSFPDTKATQVWMSSQEASEMIPLSYKFDYIHIDGDHDEGPVRFDVETWVLGHLKPGGVACFHDYDCSGVKKAVDELLVGWEREQGGRTIALRRPL